MFRYLDENMSTSQLAVSIASVIVAVGIVTLPRTAVEAVGTPDVWITFLLSGLIALGLVYICGKLTQRYPGQTFYEFNELIVGKFLGRFLSLFFAVYWLVLVSYEVRMNAEVIRFLLLEQTPIEVTIVCFMLVAQFSIVKGQSPLVRLCQMFFPITTIAILTIMLLGSNNFDIDNFRPLLREGIAPVFKGIPSSVLLYLGFEAILILAASTQDKRKITKAAIIGVCVPMVIYVVTLVMVIGILSPAEVKTLAWPTVEVIKEIEFPGSFFANFEILFIVVWVIEIFTTYTLGFYFASLGFSKVFQKEIKLFDYLFLPVVFFLAWYPADVNGVARLGDFLSNMAYFTSAVIPIVLLSVSYLRGGRHEEKTT
ncbi:GerAB/ArcD/ProY family transporter [Brevibacillus fluminis]|uniref:GerAB/ArcD/ProY family transporter n=1 Tax=Brevibacillus fluminis TaxID=511487 RepID=UPI003F8AF06F